jgi:thioesterase domain-containing protein
VVSGHGGDVFCFRALARHLRGEHPVLCVRPPGLDGGEPLKSVEELCHYEIEQIRRFRPQGPYLIAGHCAGGTLAFEVAQQLTASGQEVALLALIGSPFPTSFRFAPQIMFRLSTHAKALTSGSLAARKHYIMSKLQQRLQPPEELAGINPAVTAARRGVENATVAAVSRYKPRPYAGRIDLFVTADRWHRADRWRAVAETVCEHNLREFEINDLMIGPHEAVLAASLLETLEALPGYT